MIRLSPPPFSTDAIPKFEAAVAKATGTKYALATSSGTAAIHLALMTVGVGPGDMVLCPTFTFAATAFPIRYCGATPVFIDCDHKWDIDVKLVAKYLKDNRPPKAIICVDLYGNCNGHGKLRRLCNNYSIPIIEDAAEGLGASWKGKEAGSFGSIGIISFNLNKIVTAGGGGALVSDTGHFVGNAQYLANQAKTNASWYQHNEIGYNYRMPNSVAECGIGQIGQLQAKVAERRAVNQMYRKHLPPRFFPRSHEGHTHWLTVIKHPNPAGVRGMLERDGIESRRTWKPLHLQPCFEGCRFMGTSRSVEVFANTLCLPSCHVTEDDVRRICKILMENL